LEVGDRCSPDQDGEGDEHNILQDTTEGKNKARGSADLEFHVRILKWLPEILEPYQEDNRYVQCECNTRIS
jgi:hypothetical protein